MSHSFRDRYLTAPVGAGTIKDAAETAPSVNDTTIVTVNTNIGVQNHQWIPAATSANTNTAPGAPSSASVSGWRTKASEFLAHCTDGTVNTRDEKIVVAAGTWPVRVKFLRDNQTLSGNPSGTITAILYRLNSAGTSQEEIGRVTSSSQSFTTTATAITINITTAGTITFQKSDLIQIDLYGVFAAYASVGNANCSIRCDTEANTGSKFDAPNFDIQYAETDSDNSVPTDSKAITRDLIRSETQGPTDARPNGITEHGSAPAVVSQQGNGTVTTAAFSPPANSWVVVMVCGSWGGSACTATVTDSTGGGAWGNVNMSSTASFKGVAQVARKYFSTAQTNITVSAAFTGLDSTAAQIITTKVLVGALGPGNSATRDITSGTTLMTQSITRSALGSRVYGCVNDGNHNANFSAVDANTTKLDLNTFGGTTNVTFDSTNPTTSTGAMTMGVENTSGFSDTGGLSMLEMLAYIGTSLSFQDVDSDSAVPTDARSVSQTKGASDATVPRDSMAKTFTDVDVDNIVPTDSRSASQQKVKSDPEALIDTNSKSQTKGKTDPENLTDVRALNQTQARSDAIVPTDSLAKSFTDIDLDGSGLIDTRNIGRGFGVTDLENLYDFIMVGPYDTMHIVGGGGGPGGRTFKLDISDGMAFVDSEIQDGGHQEVTGADLIWLHDSLDMIFRDQDAIRVNSSSDTLGLSDSFVVQGGRRTLQPQDTELLLDYTELTFRDDDLIYHLDFLEPAGLTDSSKVHPGRHVIQASDLTGLSEGLNLTSRGQGQGTSLQTVDLLHLSDSVVISGGVILRPQDSVALSDTGSSHLSRQSTTVQDRMRLRDSVTITLRGLFRHSDRMRLRDTHSVELIPPGTAARSIGEDTR